MEMSDKNGKVWPEWRISWLTGLVLVAATLLVYWPVTSCDFVIFDDPDYFSANPQVQKGLTLANVAWAFTTGTAANWHPVTWLSLMLDVNLFGRKAFGPHLTNLALHAINVVLLFWLLRQMTGSQWRSTLVAALFAWHPLHVESVAWVAERKDVLCTCFGLLTLWFYVRYARVAGTGSPAPASPAEMAGAGKFWRVPAYWLAGGCFALGLMSKPMLVTWPFVMLLLDCWPLGRWQPGRHWPLVREKIPFFVLAAAACLVTFLVQHHRGAVVPVENLPFEARGENCVISYVRYLGKMIWPANLAVFYPHPRHWPVEQVVLAGTLLAGFSALFFGLRRSCPSLLTGWLWFAGTLVPVIGLVQVGAQAMADRYMYIPSVGVLILIVWGACELTRQWRFRVLFLSVAGGAALAFCAVLTREQLAYWRDSESLFRHALAVTPDNETMRHCLGLALVQNGKDGEAINEFRQAIRINPRFYQAHSNLGVALDKTGHSDEGLNELKTAILLKPDDAVAHNHLGVVLEKKGRITEAIHEYQTALRLDPDFVEACFDLGTVLAKNGQADEAAREFQAGMRLRPDDPDACNWLGIAFNKTGRINDAISQFQEALHLNPDNAEYHFNLGSVLDKAGRSAEAMDQYQTALRLKPNYSEACNNLGLNLLNQGRASEAASQFRRAIQLNPEYAEPYNNLGYVWAAQGTNLDQARELVMTANRLDPNNADILDSLGWVLLKLNRPAEGLPYQLQAVADASKPDASLYDHLGDLYASLGQRDQAAKAWRKSLSIAPSTPIQTKLDGLAVP